MFPVVMDSTIKQLDAGGSSILVIIMNKGIPLSSDRVGKQNTTNMWFKRQDDRQTTPTQRIRTPAPRGASLEGNPQKCKVQELRE